MGPFVIFLPAGIIVVMAWVNYRQIKILFVVLVAMFIVSCSDESQQETEQPAEDPNKHLFCSFDSSMLSIAAPATKEAALGKPNEAFQVAPAEFNGVDFQNFSFLMPGSKLTWKLKDGSYQYDIANDSRGWVKFADAFYLDLTGDETKEAIVMLSHVKCGASCNGGASIVYVFSADKSKPKMLWDFETGSLSSGCGLKSFNVKGKKLNFELFGNCADEGNKLIDGASDSKPFSFAGTTQFQFSYDGTKFIRESTNLVESPELDVKNHRAEIKVSE